MTKAVLFQRNGQPVLFTDYAEYDTGTGYIVAENKEIGFCYICSSSANGNMCFSVKNICTIIKS